MTPVGLVLEEASWSDADGVSDSVIEAMERLAGLLERARDDQHSIIRHDEFWACAAGELGTISDLLWSNDMLSDHRDLSVRLGTLIDQASILDDSELADYSASIAGHVRFSPGTCWAHSRLAAREFAAVLPLPLDQRLGGEIDVEVASQVRSVHFVASDSSYTVYFRRVVVASGAGHQIVQSLATSAFPALRWAETVWADLRNNKAWFTGRHAEVFVRHLAVLNDEGAALFAQNPGGMHIDRFLAAYGVDASSENGNARSNRECQRDRTRTFEGREITFWWHTKITNTKGRIHFHYEPAASGSFDDSLPGRIIIGRCVDHCYLPGS